MYCLNINGCLGGVLCLKLGSRGEGDPAQWGAREGRDKRWKEKGGIVKKMKDRNET